MADNVTRTVQSGPYVDPNITTQGTFTQALPDQGTVGRTGNLNQRTTVYDVAGTNFSPDNSDAPVYPPAPNFNKLGRDPYAVGGMDSEVNPAS